MNQSIYPSIHPSIHPSINQSVNPSIIQEIFRVCDAVVFVRILLICNESRGRDFGASSNHIRSRRQTRPQLVRQLAAAAEAVDDALDAVVSEAKAVIVAIAGFNETTVGIYMVSLLNNEICILASRLGSCPPG